MAKGIIFLPGYEEKVDLAIEQNLVEPVSKEILRDAIRNCPVDKGDLKRSLHIVRVNQHARRIGSKLSYAAAVELGSGPHIIRVRNAKVLYNEEFGEAYGKVVMHPGAKAQPYLRPALYKRR